MVKLSIKKSNELQFEMETVNYYEYELWKLWPVMQLITEGVKLFFFSKDTEGVKLPTLKTKREV